MSQWANQHPEQMEEIARLPLREQNAALRDAIGYDPDRIRDYAEERIHCHRDLSSSGGQLAPGTPPEGTPSSSSGGSTCAACGAPAGAECSTSCESNR